MDSLTLALLAYVTPRLWLNVATTLLRSSSGVRAFVKSRLVVPLLPAGSDFSWNRFCVLGRNRAVVLSIDVGIKNLAACLFGCCALRPDRIDLLRWELLEFHPDGNAPLHEVVERAVRHVLPPWVQQLPCTPSVVLIEQQPMMRNNMRSFSFALQGFFYQACPGCQVSFIPARNKLEQAPFDAPSGIANYRNRKKAAVELCNWMLTKQNQPAQWIQLFQSYKKRDDLADAYLQAMSWWETAQRTLSTPGKAAKKQKPAKKKALKRKRKPAFDALERIQESQSALAGTEVLSLIDLTEPPPMKTDMTKPLKKKKRVQKTANT